MEHNEDKGFQTHNYLAMLDSRLNKLEERRDKNLSERLDSFEKLFNVMVDTKIVAVSNLLEHLRAEKDSQYDECKSALTNFQTHLLQIKDQESAVQRAVELLRAEVDDLDDKHKEIETAVRNRIDSSNLKELEAVKWNTRVGITLEKIDKTATSNAEKIAALEKWRDTFWWKYLASGIAIATAASELLQKIWGWLKISLTQ